MTTPLLKIAALGGRAVDQAELEGIAKSAARMTDSGDLSLTEAIVHSIGHMKLNSEQVCRVVEFANTEAFNRKFASTSGIMRAVHIDGGPADPAEVLQALNQSTAPKEVRVENDDYSISPSGFGKTSSDHTYHADRTVGGIMHDVDGLRLRLRSAHEELTQDMEASKFSMHEAVVSLANSVKRASLNGAAAQEIWESWVRINPEMAKVAFERTRKFMSSGNVKVAGRQMNHTHPVVRDFRDFAKHASDFVSKHEAVMQIEHELTKVSTWLKQKRAS